MQLEDWLVKIQSTHNCDMDLSLERVASVAARLNVHKTASPVITVAGTNGKGSTVAALEAIYMAAGFKVGVFTSPILFRHNEYVRIQGQEAHDDAFCHAFDRIEKARETTSLTPFEFNTLAALDIFHQSKLDVWILEVGLGGRFDAVNVIDADASIVTSIGIDHVDWLGDTREKIAYEKAGIFRKNKPAICGDSDPPATLINYANDIESILYCQNKQFGFKKKNHSWDWWSESNHFENLALPKLALSNMSTVLMTVELLQNKLPVSEEIIKQTISTVSLPGRIQVIPGDITQILDVSHNPAAAEFLAVWLKEQTVKGKTRAVFSMLSDKDIYSTLLVMKNVIDEWHVASLDTKRGASMDHILNSFHEANIKNVTPYSSIEEAHLQTLKQSKLADRVVVFGSFHVVGKILQKIPSRVREKL